MIIPSPSIPLISVLSIMDLGTTTEAFWISSDICSNHQRMLMSVLLEQLRGLHRRLLRVVTTRQCKAFKSTRINRTHESPNISDNANDK